MVYGDVCAAAGGVRVYEKEREWEHACKIEKKWAHMPWFEWHQSFISSDNFPFCKALFSLVQLHPCLFISQLPISLVLFLSLQTFFFGGGVCVCGMWKFPDQGSNVCHRIDLSHGSDTRSLTHWATRKLHPSKLLILLFSFSCFFPYLKQSLLP